MSRRKKRGRVEKLTPEEREARARMKMREGRRAMADDRELRERAEKSGIEIVKDLRALEGLPPDADAFKRGGGR
jgi:hypothetical protein